MNEEREPDATHYTYEVELGEPTRGAEGMAEDVERPDPAELQARISETRKPMGPPLEDEDQDAPLADMEAPPLPPPTDPVDPE